MNRKGLMVNVLRPADGRECTNGGVSSTHERVFLCGEGVSGPATEEEADKDGTPVLVVGFIKFGGTKYLHAKPRDVKGHAMFGGNYIGSSDSRFSDVNPYPIPVHDRVE